MNPFARIGPRLCLLAVPTLLLHCSFVSSFRLASQTEANDLTGRFESSTFRSGDSALPYRLLRPVQPSGKEHPLLIFFHGAGERGSDNKRPLKHIIPFLSRKDIPIDDLYVLVPQCPPGQRWVETDWSLPSHRQPADPSGPMRAVFALLNRLLATESIDPGRVYLMGLSMGGFGVWDALTRFPDRFAAGVAVCGGADEATAARLLHTPVWVFHGARDTTVLPARSRRMVAALQKLGTAVHYTEYPDVGHVAWIPAFQDRDLPGWLFAQRRSIQRPH